MPDVRGANLPPCRYAHAMPRSSPAKIVALKRDLSTADWSSGRLRQAPSESRSITAKIVLTPRAAERLVRAVASGTDRYILVTADGGLSLHVRLAIDPNQPDEQRVGNGKLVVDWPLATISSGRNHVTISRTELRLLGGLLEGNGHPVPRAQLIARAWPRDQISPTERDNALAVYICTLRKHLAAIGLGHALLTVRGLGYRLMIR
jgi:DNA-binding response OmpR family regulator